MVDLCLGILEHLSRAQHKLNYDTA
jgi:hypothetical protein